MEENNTGGWCAPADVVLEMHNALAEAVRAEFPVVSIERGGVMYPMPQLDTIIFKKARSGHWWQFGYRYFVRFRQYGQDAYLDIGPYRKKEHARKVEREIYAWYASMYNVIIRTYKATERNKK